MERNKCWVSAVKDKSINNMKIEEVRELIGFIEPIKDVWMVTLCDDGSFYDCKTQTEAMILATEQQLLFLALKKDRAEKFVSHIENHLCVGDKVICKICGRDIDNINQNDNL